MKIGEIHPNINIDLLNSVEIQHEMESRFSVPFLLSCIPGMIDATCDH